MQVNLKIVVKYWIVSVPISDKTTAAGREQLDIPKGYNSKWFLFWKVLFWSVIILKFFILKGHYSEDFYPEWSLFQRFLSQRSLFQILE